MPDLRLVRGVVAICGALWAGLAQAQGSGTLDVGAPELMMSIGTTAHLLDLTPDPLGAIRGVPTSSFEVRKGEVVPIDPQKFVLAFRGSSVPYGRLVRTVVLSEDGVWALAALKDEKDSAYFLTERQIRAMAAPGPGRSWGLVNSPIVGEGVRFDAREVVLLEALPSQDASVVLDRQSEVTGPKFLQVSATRPPAARNTAPQDQIKIVLSAADRQKITTFEVSRSDEFLQMSSASESRFASFGNFFNKQINLFPQRLTKWNKTFRLPQTTRLDCNQEKTLRQKDAVDSKVGADVKASLASDQLFSGLKALGLSFGVGSEASVSKAWSGQEETLTTIKDLSFVMQQFLFSYGNQTDGVTVAKAKGCKPDDNAYFFVVAPSSSGNAVDNDTMTKMAATIKGLTRMVSGHLSTSCFSSYLGAISYLTDDVALDDRAARLVASRIIRVKPQSTVDTFYGC